MVNSHNQRQVDFFSKYFLYDIMEPFLNIIVIHCPTARLCDFGQPDCATVQVQGEELGRSVLVRSGLHHSGRPAPAPAAPAP